MKYKWNIKDNYEFSKDFIDICFGSEVIAKIITNRGITDLQKAKEYLNPKNYTESNPEEIPDLIKARDRIIQAVEKNEKITIFGDYDVDGVTSTSCMLITLKKLTDSIDFYIPNRLLEGYGLNSEAIKTLATKNKTKLLITCDCGITNINETEYAKSLGIDVIITDHHSLPDNLPKAHAVLNPKLLPENHKLHNLPGVGVAYKLCESIISKIKDLNFSESSIIDPKSLLDLVTLGMIADLALLVRENRYLVQTGIERLAKTERVGLKELLRICGYSQSETMTTEHIGFGIAPRINAVGRLTDANLAVKLMTTDNLIEALHLSSELDIQNKQRQVICDETLSEAITLVSEQVDLKNDKCIVLAKENWHHGVVGIVASRVVEKYHLPTILIGVDIEQNIGRGSGRSIEKLNIVEALSKCSNHLERFGGHKAACGLSIKPENINEFISGFKRITEKELSTEDIEAILNIDLHLPLGDLNFDLIEKINRLAPFGLGNRLPVFESNEVEVAAIREIGKNKQHLKLLLKDLKTNHFIDALLWNYDRFKDSLDEVSLKDKIKIAYTPKINEFNGETLIQLEIKDYEITQKKESYKKDSGEKSEIKIYDFRGNTNECMAIFSNSTDTTFFAEVSQKDFLPIKTNSRNRLSDSKKLILFEAPPDEFTLHEILNSTKPEEIYLAFPVNLKSSMINPQASTLEPTNMLKRLTGMLRYVVNQKNGKINKKDLECALGINRTTLVFALEVLTKTGTITYEQSLAEINVNISTPTRQNFKDLIEYNLFVSELKQINDFCNWLSYSQINEIAKKLSKNNKIFITSEKVTI